MVEEVGYLPEKLTVHDQPSLEEDYLSALKSSVIDETGRGTDHCWALDIERLDELIGRYLPVAMSAEQDFHRALRASYIVLDLIDMQVTLLESHIGGRP
jgi:hypothetical protein